MCSSTDKLSYVSYALALIEFEDCSPYLAAHLVLPHLRQTGRHSLLEHYLEADRAQGEGMKQKYAHSLDTAWENCIWLAFYFRFLLFFSLFLSKTFARKTPDETLYHAFKYSHFIGVSVSISASDFTVIIATYAVGSHSRFVQERLFLYSAELFLSLCFWHDCRDWCALLVERHEPESN